MAEEVKGNAVLEEPVVRIMELQSRYGMDQETMLIYMCSVNLMSILSLIGRRYPGSSSGYIQVPVAETGAVSVPVPAGNAGDNPSISNLTGMLAGMLGGQGGAGGQGFNPAALLNMLGSIAGKDGQGLNPALLTSLLGALGGQDLSGFMGTLAGLMGSGPKPAVKPDVTKDEPDITKDKPATPSNAATSGAGTSKEAGAARSSRGEEKQADREMPRIMKWDRLGDRKRA